MLLEVENLNLYFQSQKSSIHALRDISFHLKPGETLGIVGESGCGKSITNLALMNLLDFGASFSAKKMKLESKELQKLKESQWRRIRGKDISMIFQDPMSSLNPAFNVGYQLNETIKIHRPELSKKERLHESIELLKLVGIPSAELRLSSYAHELSGGMSQRVMIALAIACEPKLLIADEPTTALDVTIQKQILDLLKRIQEKKNMAIILVTHDIGVVYHYSHRLQVMYAGEIVEQGPTKEVIQNPAHPYTKGLIRSLPNAPGNSHRSNLNSIAGMVPDFSFRPKGCQFAPRCPKVDSICHKSDIELLQNDKRSYRCLYPEGAVQ